MGDQLDDIPQDAHWSSPLSVASSESTPAIVRVASSTLNALNIRGTAGASSASAALVKTSFEGFAPNNRRSAIVARQGLWATPPRARRISLIKPPSILSAAATESRAKA